MKMRPPAIPLLNIDPYFSVWAEDSLLKRPVHWTGSPNHIWGRALVDGKAYRFLGEQPAGCTAEAMTVESMEIDAFSTVITYTCPEIRLTVHFTSPTLITELYYVSRPVAYCKVSYESLDGKDHEVKAAFSCSEELVLNKAGEGRAYSRKVELPGLTAIKMGNGCQKVLWRSGDDVRIDWGYLYLAVTGDAEADNEVISDLYSIYAQTKLEPDALFLFAYDDIDSMVYFGDRLPAYWKKDGKTIEEAICEAAADYDSLLAKCDAFSEKLKADALAKGNEDYAELLLLAYRQVIAAHKLVVDKEGNNLFISKECFSNGCAATVDVTYPSAPLFLLYNTELLKGMLRPIMRYAQSEAWEYDFAPHDVGQYPLVNGQVYGDNRREYQMPVEECGNMIVLFAAICDRDDSTDFAQQYLPTLKLWSKYLIEYGYDPEHQLCTDDFAGRLAHNVNLSIKAIMGIAGLSRILARMGEAEEAEALMAKAREYASSIPERAANDDGSCSLAFGAPGTFSLKYNAIWDKIWGTSLFPASFYEAELARYKKELLPYGVPLDSREKYTKSDWLVWAASLSDDPEVFALLIHSLWSAYNTMRTWAPMTDWYYCDTSDMRGFRHRTVQGGLYIKLLLPYTNSY